MCIIGLHKCKMKVTINYLIRFDVKENFTLE